MASEPAVQVSRKVIDVLLQAGVLKQEQFEAVLAHMRSTGERAEESIIELGFAGEAEILKALAARFKTHFVSTEKLAKADIVRATLDLIPRRFAEKSGICPVMFDQKTLTLSVVTSDPDNVEALKEVQLASGAREVKAFVARPAAVKAIIAKAYGGDIHAFALLDRQAHAQFHAMLNVYERNLVSDESMTTSLAKEKFGRGERMISERQLARAAQVAASPAAGGFAREHLLELLNVFVSLLEQSRPDLRGHSSQVAALCRQMATRMSLDEVTAAAVVAAGHLHDIGKMGQYHMTALNVAEYEGHRTSAQKSHAIPDRLLSPAHLPEEALEAVSHMYERYDGKGFPDGLSGKDIPLSARLLAIIDTYADLTQNARNPYRKCLSPEDACKVLGKFKERVFDPHLVDLFRQTVLGNDLKAKLLSNRYTALIADVEPEETTILELRMIEAGFVVKTARNAEQMLKILAEGDIDLVVSEIELSGTDGLKVLAEARKQAWGKDLPWVIYTGRSGKAEAQQAFALGVMDFVTKPAKTDVFVAKLKALLDQRAAPKARGVSGSLKEMALPDLVQVMFHARKTGNLRIRGGGEMGEIHFQEGNIVNALWGQARGEHAFYAMLKLSDGEFGLDPSFVPQTRVIHESTEGLLLEGMRRLDEGLV